MKSTLFDAQLTFRPPSACPATMYHTVTTWMPRPCRINNMAGTSTPYEPGRPGRRARITSHGSVPGAQQHQKPQPGHAPPASDQTRAATPGDRKFGTGRAYT